MTEADSDASGSGIDISRIIFFSALTLLSGYFFLVASTDVTSPLVIVSGSSMEPTYHAGDLLLVEAVVPSSIVEGDVVVFHTPRKGISAGLPSRIAHRVVGIQPVDGMIGYLTRGDNSDRDSFVVPSNLLIGSVRSNLGPIGKLLAFVTNLKLLLIVGLPLAVVGGVFWILTRDEEEETESEPEKSPVQTSAKPDHTKDANARFVSPHEDRMADRAAEDVKQWLMTHQPSPGVRKAFDEVTERLDQIRTQRPARGGNG